MPNVALPQSPRAKACPTQRDGFPDPGPNRLRDEMTTSHPARAPDGKTPSSVQEALLPAVLSTVKRQSHGAFQAGFSSDPPHFWPIVDKGCRSVDVLRPVRPFETVPH